LLALLAEQAYAQGMAEVTQLPAPPSVLVPRIGEYLLEQGLISDEQLRQALARQKESTARGEHRLLGQTLVEMGFVDRGTLDGAISRQIIALHGALQEANRTLEHRVAERTAELRNAIERLAEINQLKANLISNVSHELRTPLAHLKGYVELLMGSHLGPLTKEQDSALAVVHRSMDRLEQLIEDLIEFSTASREGIRVELRQVALPSLVANVIERSQEKAAKARVQLETHLADGLPELRGDPQRLSWVLYQLVDNGIKFTPAGGQVTLAARNENQLVRVEVKDTGIGIPSDRLDEIFEPLHQLDGSSTRRYGGTGIGLALVKLILEAHGAELHVTSEEGKGSAFWFYLPAAQGGK
jgi:signal transduction histidine kinase